MKFCFCEAVFLIDKQGEEAQNTISSSSTTFNRDKKLQSLLKIVLENGYVEDALLKTRFYMDDWN